MGQIGHSSPQQWSEEFTAAYMGSPPPTRWSIQRANGKYKDHLDGQLTSVSGDGVAHSVQVDGVPEHLLRHGGCMVPDMLDLSV